MGRGGQPWSKRDSKAATPWSATAIAAQRSPGSCPSVDAETLCGRLHLAHLYTSRHLLHLPQHPYDPSFDPWAWAASPGPPAHGRAPAGGAAAAAPAPAAPREARPQCPAPHRHPPHRHPHPRQPPRPQPPLPKQLRWVLPIGCRGCCIQVRMAPAPPLAVQAQQVGRWSWRWWACSARPPSPAQALLNARAPACVALLRYAARALVAPPRPHAVRRPTHGRQQAAGWA